MRKIRVFERKLHTYTFFPNFYLLVSSFISTYVWFTTLYSIIQIKFKLHPLFYGLTPGCLRSPFSNMHLLFSNSHLIRWVSRTDSLEAENITSTRNKQRRLHQKLVSPHISLIQPLHCFFDQYHYLGNCLPTPPLTQQQLMSGQGQVGSCPDTDIDTLFY